MYVCIYHHIARFKDHIENFEKRIENKIRDETGQDQLGFKTSRGTRDVIAVMRTLKEQSIELEKDLYISFVAYEETFDQCGLEG